VVHTLTPDRSDQSLGKAILPRRGWCDRLVPDAHGSQSARDDAAIDPVAIADEVAGSLIPGKSLRYLTCNPFSCRVCCDVDPDEVSVAEPDDDEGIEQVETDSLQTGPWRQCPARGCARRSAIPGWVARVA
jgi:hypothetical protein